MKQSYGGHKPQLTLYSSDQKFLLIPLFFLLFRIGSVVFSILYVYTNLWRQMEYAWKMFVYYCMVSYIHITRKLKPTISGFHRGILSIGLNN